MHISAAGQANFATWAPVIVTGLLLFAIARWGAAKTWEVVVIALAGVVLSGTVLGPFIHQALAAISAGHLH